MSGANSQPPPLDPIRAGLALVRRRMHLNRLLAAVFFDGLVALGLFAAYLLLDRLVFVGLDALLVFAILQGTALAASLARVGIFRRLSPFQAAALVDDRLRLKDRVASAVFVREGSAEPFGIAAPRPLEPWRLLVERDGARALEGLDLKQSFPVRLPRQAAWAAAALLAVALIPIAVPQLDLLGLRRARAAEAQMKEEVQKEIDHFKKQIEELKKENPKVEDPELKKLLEALANQNRLANREEPPKKDLPEEPGDQTKKEALTQFTRLEEALKQSLEKAEFKDLKNLFDNFKAGNSAALTRPLQEALKEGKFDQAGEELKKLKDDLEKLLKKKEAGELSKEEMERLEKLASELARLSKSAASLSRLSKSLSSLSGSLSLGDLAQALENLEQADTDLETLQQLMEQMQFLDQSLELAQFAKGELGKLHRCPNCGKLRKGDQPGGT
ncbi:MAG: hypothetical protein HY717_05540 [Planctomycetes bacterium]|nr:hypothetical protein [Planctomycetota bacterium]